MFNSLNYHYCFILKLHLLTACHVIIYHQESHHNHLRSTLQNNHLYSNSILIWTRTQFVKMAYQWSTPNSTILREHLKYHEDMLAYLQQLQSEGPELSEDMPRKPKWSIQSLLGIKKSSTKLAGMKLHEYLLTCIDSAVCQDLQRKWNPADLRHIRDTLVVGYKALQRHHANTLADSIDYGYFLNKAFDFFSHEKLTGVLDEKDLTTIIWQEEQISLMYFIWNKNIKLWAWNIFWRRKINLPYCLSFKPILCFFRDFCSCR